MYLAQKYSFLTSVQNLHFSVTVWHEIFDGSFAGVFFFGGLAIFCVLRELIFAIRIDCFLFLGTNFFAIFRNYAVPGIDNIFVFIEYVRARALGTCNRITLYYFQTIQLRCAYPM